MTYPCPSCGAPATLSAGCPGCGRAPDPDAAEVVRLDAEIRELMSRREAAAARVRAQQPPAPPQPARPRGPEASPKLVQNALFVLGGMLLGVAAIVFTAVAWSQFGIVGRAVVLGAFTLAALAAPLPARRRGLTATAETFAAVGLVLLLCDGYAAWYVDLFGVAGFSTYGYAGAVCAVTAAIAVGYEHLTGLSGPRYAALVVAQPVLPLVVQPLGPDLTGWSFVLSGVAALNLLVLHLRPGPLTGTGVAARVFGGLAVAAAGLAALIALLSAEPAGELWLAAAALVTAAGVLLVGTILSGPAVVRDAGGALFVVAVSIAAARLADHGWAPVGAAAAVAVIAAGVASLHVAIRRGPRVGGLVTVGAAGLVCLVRVADVVAGGDRPDWQLPVAIVLLTAGGFALWRTAAVPVAGVALAALATVYAAGLPVRVTAFGVLAAGAVLILVRQRVAQLSAHAAALVALVLVSGSARYAAAVLTLWGLALAVRALIGGPRRAYAIAAAVAELGGCWLLLASADVAVLEAYTIPAAVVALFAGWLVTRSKPELSSWVAFAPALAAALLPTLARVLVEDGEPVRRLALGVGALLVVLAGARAQLRAPVVSGGVVLAVLALHEAAQVWDLLPRWIPLAAAGLLLVGLAMTLERRRRELGRLRAALHRMS